MRAKGANVVELPGRESGDRRNDVPERTESSRAVPFTVKTCPRCGATLFEDMRVCYGCLFDFDREPAHYAELPSTIGSPFFGTGKREASGSDPDSTSVLRFDADERLRRSIVMEVGICSMRLPLDGGREVVVGRDPSCDIVIGSRNVSRRHLRISDESGRVVCEDLDATNPAYVNGIELKDRRVVGKDSVIDICGTQIVIR